MSFLLDTTALSELTKLRPNRGFLEWMAENTAQEAFVGSPSVGELEIGICLLEHSQKRRSLAAWLKILIDEFGQRILPFDVACAQVWGQNVAAARLRGKTFPATDSQIAAIAAVHGLSVVTRNARHFLGFFPGLEVVNPWSNDDQPLRPDPI